ncbi:hypothetical protein B9479_007222 [Cryptococcus floricola]|uniref:Uncharacterized protein n=1 Tax=Cryptococcus floricola TaxID=2591691 RepID=A0A5D3AKY0_9TREE|nr:hypothetical protein B9479_007222 [Cryptococcus floricola]
MAPDSNEPGLVEDQYKVNIGPQRSSFHTTAIEKPQIPLLDLFALVFELAGHDPSTTIEYQKPCFDASEIAQMATFFKKHR